MCGLCLVLKIRSGSNLWIVGKVCLIFWLISFPGAHAELGSATGMEWKTWQSDNKIDPPMPYSIPLVEKLVTAGSTEVTVVLHAGRKRKQNLSLLFIYREVCRYNILILFLLC
jgi:hypothetical protein